MPDDEACIGDRYRIGEVELEITQPRVTCYRVGLRLGEPELPALLVSHHRPGFYMRVLTEGHIEAGDEIIKTGSGPGASASPTPMHSSTFLTATPPSCASPCRSPP